MAKNCLRSNSASLNYFCNRKNMFEKSGEQLYSLFNYICNTKHACSNQARGCFFTFIWLLLNYETYVSKAAFVIQKVHVQNKGETVF